jgi:hypothetical protein
MNISLVVHLSIQGILTRCRYLCTYGTPIINNSLKNLIDFTSALIFNKGSEAAQSLPNSMQEKGSMLKRQKYSNGEVRLEQHSNVAV